MAYETPKTDWTNSDSPVATDFNRIEGNSLDAHDRVAVEAAALIAETAARAANTNGTTTQNLRLTGHSSLPAASSVAAGRLYYVDVGSSSSHLYICVTGNLGVKEWRLIV